MYKKCPLSSTNEFICSEAKYVSISGPICSLKELFVLGVAYGSEWLQFSSSLKCRQNINQRFV